MRIFARPERRVLQIAFSIFIGLLVVITLFAPGQVAFAQSPGLPGLPGLTLPQQAQPPQPPLPPRMGKMMPIQAPGPRQIFRDDLTVEGGQVINEDVFVYDGDVTVNGGGVIRGNLVVFNGDVEVQGGANVEGNLTAYTGDVEVGGRIGGNVAAMSGDVDLLSGARVEGDVSALAGDIERDDGASVVGSVVEGPDIPFPAVPGAVVPMPGVDHDNSPGFFGRLMGFLLRLLGAGLMTALVTLLVAGIFYGRPQLIARTRKTLTTQRPLSFVTGLVANLTLSFLAFLLTILVCTVPLALLLMVVLLAVNLVGWAVASQIVGERIVTALKTTVQPVLTLIVGAVTLTGVAALLWALGGCFQVIGFLFILTVASFGTGAVLVPWINRRRDDGGTSGSGDGSDSDGGGNIPIVPAGPGGSGGAVNIYPADQDVAGPIDHVTAEEVNDLQAGGELAQPAGTLGGRDELVEEEHVGRTSGGARAIVHEEIDDTQESDTTPAPVPPAGNAITGNAMATPGRPVGDTSDNTIDTDVAQPLDYVTAEEINAAPTPTSQGTASDQPTASGSSRTSRGQEQGIMADDQVVEEDVAQPLDYVTAEEVNETEAQPPSQRQTTRNTTSAAPTATGDGPVTEQGAEAAETDVAQPLDYVTAEEVNTEQVATEDDDFTRIKGVGPVTARRLKDAGLQSFADLAGATPEQVAEVLGWPVDRVQRSEIIDLARSLRQG